MKRSKDCDSTPASSSLQIYGKLDLDSVPNGQTWRVFNQREMQWKWKAWLQIPQATVHSVQNNQQKVQNINLNSKGYLPSLVVEAWLAWHSMPTI